MPYTKPDQTPFINLRPNEFVVTLDTGENVAVFSQITVQQNTGSPAVSVEARVVDATGSDTVDAAGQTIHTGFSHVTEQNEIASVGSVQAVQKLCILAVLGESTAPLWQDAIHATMLQTASIRTNIASAAHAGPATDLGSLL